jgi:hypothetical protein
MEYLVPTALYILLIYSICSAVTKCYIKWSMQRKERQIRSEYPREFSDREIPVYRLYEGDKAAYVFMSTLVFLGIVTIVGIYHL